MASNSVTTPDSLERYFQEISRYPLLSPEEEVELSKRALQGDGEAQERLVNCNLRLVVRIARAYTSSGMSLMDLIQEGNLGLMTAAKKFDWRKGVRFSTYAAWWIKQGILRALSNKKRLIRIPHRKEEAVLRVEKFIQHYTQDHGEEPDTPTICRATGLSPRQVQQIRLLIQPVQSLDQETTEDGACLIDTVEDYTYDPYLVIDRQATQEEVQKMLELLAEREKKVLMYRFAFYGGKKYTLKTISKEMGISAETVRQIEIRAIQKLRQRSVELGVAV